MNSVSKLICAFLLVVVNGCHAVPAEAVGTCRTGALYCVDSEGFVHAQGIVLSGAFAITGDISTTGSIASTKACATGFTRVTPNFCRATTLSQQGYTEAASCTGRFVDSNIPNGSYAIIDLQLQALANNGAGERGFNTSFYNDAGCSVQLSEINYSVYEQTAVAAATVIGRGHATVLVRVLGGFTYAWDSNTGGNGVASVNKFSIVGYFD